MNDFSPLEDRSGQPTGSPAGTYRREHLRGRAYDLYIPASLPSNGSCRLVVLLHGCRQTATDFARDSGSVDLAEQKRFLLALPEQSSQHNAQRCWNWFMRKHQKRGRGEPAAIASITRRVVEQWKLDSQNVFLAGFSAGGAMTSLMSVLYSDLYAGAGIHSGVQYGAATSVSKALRVMKNGGPGPLENGTDAFKTMLREVPDRVREVPTVVLHGSEDERVDVENAHQVAKQIFTMNLLAQKHRNGFQGSPDPRVHVEEHEGEERSYTEVRYENRNGVALVKKYIVRGMAHAWSGGAAGQPFMDPQGPCALRLMWKFFTEP